MNNHTGKVADGGDEFAGWDDLPTSADQPDVDEPDVDQPDGAQPGRPDVDDLSGFIQVLNDTLEDFDRRLTRIEDDVADAAEEEAAARPKVVDLETVSTWVAWLIDTYQLDDKIPAKWKTIPGVHQELTALCAAWTAAYDPETTAAAVGFGAAQWHDALGRTLERVQAWSNTHTTRSNRHR